MPFRVQTGTFSPFSCARGGGSDGRLSPPSLSNWFPSCFLYEKQHFIGNVEQKQEAVWEMAQVQPRRVVLTPQHPQAHSTPWYLVPGPAVAMGTRFPSSAG